MITIKTKIKASLLSKRIVVALTNNEIKEWEIDSENDMTLSQVSYKNRSWMHIENMNGKDNQLIISIIGPVGTCITSSTYAVFHTKFVEMLLKSFDAEIESIEVSSALIAGVDKCLNFTIGELGK